MRRAVPVAVWLTPHALAWAHASPQGPEAFARTAAAAGFWLWTALLGALLYVLLRRCARAKPAGAQAPAPASAPPAATSATAPANPEAVADEPGRLRLALWLSPLTYAAYGVCRISASDAWTARPWSAPLLTLGAAAALALAVSALRRLGGRAARWTANLALGAGVLLAPVVAFPVFVGWNVPLVLPNTMAFSGATSLPDSTSTLAEFREVRLILCRTASILQATSRVLVVVGKPHAYWYRAFEARGGATEEYRSCATAQPDQWDRVDCEAGAGWSCYRCKSGNWNHPRFHHVAFSPDGERAVFYVGTGPSFNRAVRDAGLLELAASDARLRHRPATSELDPERERMFERMRSTSPHSLPLSAGERERVKGCLLARNLACLQHFLRYEPSGRWLEPFLTDGIPYARTSAALALARVRHPGALAHLLAQTYEDETLDTLVLAADALAEYGKAAAPSVPRLIARADEHVLAPPLRAHHALVRPMARLGTLAALDYVERLAQTPIRLDSAEAIDEAFRALPSPAPPAAVARLRRWVKLQEGFGAQHAHPLLSALQRAGGTDALRPHRAWIKRMQPDPERYDAWGRLRSAVERP